MSMFTKLHNTPYMTHGRAILSLLILFLSCGALYAQDASKDVGKDQIGKVKTTVYFGTNGSTEDVGKNAIAVLGAELKRLQGIKKMRFKNYRKLGDDTRSVLRSYENWASPLKPSEEIMLSFESRGRNEQGGLKLDLELWQHKRKVMKSDPLLYKGRPLLILGPKWRSGRLIISVELIELSSKS